mmetsp:Transcript_100701/g.260106  ORF Transcript_100701/g.260106 Transcript_100701/m.260106 type:complete len:435 (-) Transcript_100701:84-1388(-)
MAPIELGGDHYQVLGVPRHAAEAEITKAYKRLALIYHPDKNPGDEERAQENFRLLTEAYEVLRDPEKRRSYNILLPSWVSACPGAGMAEKEQPGNAGCAGFGNGSGGIFETDTDDLFMSFFGHADPFAGFFATSQPQSSRVRSGSTGASRYPSQPGARDPTQPSARRTTTTPSSFGSSMTSPMGFGSSFPGSELLGGGLSGGSCASRAESFNTPRSWTSESRSFGLDGTAGRTQSGSRSWPQMGTGTRGMCSGGLGSLFQGGGSSGSTCHTFLVPEGTNVVVQAGGEHRAHDGKAARVLGWDTASGLYEVELESRLKIRLSRQGIVQKFRVEITDLVSRPEVNGRLGDIFGCDDEAGRYLVLIKTGALPVTLSVHCGNCILKLGTRVVIRGLEKNLNLNGSMSQIVGVDRKLSRYTVECQDGRQVKVKYGNVRC